MWQLAFDKMVQMPFGISMHLNPRSALNYNFLLMNAVWQKVMFKELEPCVPHRKLRWNPQILALLELFQALEENNSAWKTFLPLYISIRNK